MPTRTPSQIGRANLAKSKRDERAVAEYLRPWYPLAERAVRTGFRTAVRASADPGDIGGVPGCVISVKSWEDPTTVERKVADWLAELDAMQPGDLTVNPVRLLVIRRYGKTSPADWWCFTRARTLFGLYSPDVLTVASMHATVRIRFADVVELLALRRLEAVA